MSLVIGLKIEIRPGPVLHNIVETRLNVSACIFGKWAIWGLRKIEIVLRSSTFGFITG